jgi:hypothetical protein
MSENKVTPEKCLSAYQQFKHEQKLLWKKEEKTRQSQINRLVKELIQEIDPYLESGNLPKEVCSTRKVIEKLNNYYSCLGWSCSIMHLIEYSYLKVNFPGLCTILWWRIKNFFLRFFKSKKLLSSRKTAYRD